MIISARNEAPTIAGPIEAALSTPGVGRVIVVDDGSNDRTGEIARLAGAEVIRRDGAGSKALAMREGLRASNADVIVFFDGDIIAPAPEHLEGIVAPVLDGTAPLSIGVVSYGAMLDPLFLRLPPISGLRAMKRWVFEAVPPEKLRGLQIEIMINEVIARRRLPFAVRTLRGCRHRTKRDKLGLVRGWSSQLAMVGELLGCLKVVPLWTYGSFLGNLHVLAPVVTGASAVSDVGVTAPTGEQPG